MTKPRAGKSSRRAPADRAARHRVDDIVQQWRTERPDIDPVPAQIYGLIGRIHIQSTAFIDEILAPHQLARGTFDVLTALRRAGAPYCLTPKALAESLLLSGAGLNSRINRLEDIRYIARLPEPTDRRTVRIQLTTTGESVINQVIPQVFEAQWRRLRALDEASLSRLAAELSRLADAMDSIKS